MKMKISFESHHGFLHQEENNRVEFYRMSFDFVQEAIQFLKNLKPPVKDEEYHPWFYRGKKGLFSTADSKVFIDGLWFPDDDFAENYINRK